MADHGNNICTTCHEDKFGPKCQCQEQPKEMTPDEKRAYAVKMIEYHESQRLLWAYRLRVINNHE